MATVRLTIAARSNQSRFGIEGAARLLNCYAEPLGDDAKAKFTVYVIEGLDTWRTVINSGGIKCLLATETYLYGVAGKNIFAINTSGTVTTLGTYAAEGPCFMARNRRNPTTQVGLVNATTGQYHYIENTTLTLSVDPDLQGPPSSIATKDGYFAIPTNFGRYFITGEDDAANIGATMFGKAQRSPDAILRVLSSETDLMLLGENSIEWHQNQPTGDGSFPFVPVAQIELGLIGVEAATKIDRTVAWVANDGTVRVMNGYGGDRVSSHAVERWIGSLAAPEDLQMWAYNSKSVGQTWIVLSADEGTWVYGLRTGDWHERRSFGLTRWRATQSVEWQGLTLVGDYATGEIYSVSGDAFTDAGERIIMECQFPPVDAAPHPLQINSLSVDILPGRGLASGDTSDMDPELVLTWSDDGGATFSTERRASLGAGGATNTRCRFHRLGHIRRNGRTFKVSCAANVARAITGAQLDVDRLGA